MLVIGNGESRTKVDLDKFDCTKIGCNAIFRDYKNIDHIICVDKRMVNEAIDAGISTKIYTRTDWISRYKNYPNILEVPTVPTYKGDKRKDEPFHWGSGPYAILLSTKFSTDIRIIGFDLYGIDNKVNNIYKNTNNYVDSNKRAIDPSYWIHQIGKVFKSYPKHNFIIYQEDSWKLPNEWKFSNVVVDNINKL